jgi:hypothetical protein
MRLLFAWFLSCFSWVYSGGFAGPRGSQPNYIFLVTIDEKTCADSRQHAREAARWEFDSVLFESLSYLYKILLNKQIKQEFESEKVPKQKK